MRRRQLLRSNRINGITGDIKIAKTQYDKIDSRENQNINNHQQEAYENERASKEESSDPKGICNASHRLLSLILFKSLAKLRKMVPRLLAFEKKYCKKLKVTCKKNLVEI